MFTDEQKKIVKAFMDGQRVQYRNKGTKIWLDKFPIAGGDELWFDFRDCDYRLEPEEEYLIVLAYKAEGGTIATIHRTVRTRSGIKSAEIILKNLRKSLPVIDAWITKL